MTSNAQLPPHGGVLVNRLIADADRSSAETRAASLPSITLTPVQHADLVCIATGVLSPLTGFMGRADYESVVERMRLANGTVWSIPVTLAVDAAEAKRLPSRGEIALREPGGRLAGTMEIQEQYTYDRAREAKQVYRTDETAHPGVARLFQQGDVLLAGPITLINRPANEPFADFRRDPVETTSVAASLVQLAGVKDSIERQFQAKGLFDRNLGSGGPAYSETFYPFSSFGWSPLHALESERGHVSGLGQSEETQAPPLTARNTRFPARITAKRTATESGPVTDTNAYSCLPPIRCLSM
jgi:hypothetical protein